MLAKNNKKGELTITQIVTLIVLITSFVIILFLIFKLNLGGTTEQEICRNSVVLRGQSTLIAGPLDCKTQYVCISGGEECQGISATEKIEANTREEAMKALAEKMSSCWYVFGEGKVDYVDEELFENVACSVCSITGFGENLKGESHISYQDFYEYLATTKKTDSQTYFQYLYPGKGIYNLGDGFNPKNYLDNQIEFGKSYFILTGEVKEGNLLVAPWKIFNTKFIPQPVVILENTEENYNVLGCDEFLTKA